ncbi:TPA: LPXTG cell wall anchor domain-containing protein, partial [Staphylococcus pseudintermedius]|nr:LPXTG cell wall anchor domain-containing protein [Staphylococcus pseudintermedius]
KHTTANTEKDSDGLIANIDVTQDDMSIDAGFFPLENWNPQPEPKNPDDKEKPAPEQPDAPQPKPMLPGEKVKPKPTHPGEAMQTTPQDKSTSQTDEALPKTGESSSQSSALIFGGLLSLLGLGLLRRSSKQNRSSMK